MQSLHNWGSSLFLPLTTADRRTKYGYWELPEAGSCEAIGGCKSLGSRTHVDICGPCCYPDAGPTDLGSRGLIVGPLRSHGSSPRLAPETLPRVLSQSRVEAWLHARPTASAPGAFCFCHPLRFTAAHSSTAGRTCTPRQERQGCLPAVPQTDPRLLGCDRGRVGPRDPSPNWVAYAPSAGLAEQLGGLQRRFVHPTSPLHPRDSALCGANCTRVGARWGPGHSAHGSDQRPG